MRAQRDEIEQLLREGRVVARREHPHLSGTLDRLLRSGDLCAVLPGVYAEPARAADFGTRVLALRADVPDAVLVGRAAAKLTFWPSVKVDAITCAVPSRRVSRPGYAFVTRRVPPELVTHRYGLQLTTPALTAMDLCDDLGGDPIDWALRTRTATLAQLHQALDLTRYREGNRNRRMLLLDSRDEPWSKPERLYHRMLRDAGISGWKANRPVCVDGSTFFIDVAFKLLRLAVEIDGRLHETDLDIFENDRWRQNALVLDGWRVIRFTWRMLTEHPEEVLTITRRAMGEVHR